jgi:tetratricopeptide (TPR) repeat protein
VGISDEVRALRHGVALSAHRQFTNRHSETAAFSSKAAEVKARRSDQPDVNLDLSAGRQNLLVFFGTGGIGKTRLSNECERIFREADRPKGTRTATVRIDFSEPSARDAELYLFALRAGLAPIAESFPAFDTCLALYWARRHPGTSMDDFVRNQSLLGGLVDREALAENLRDFITGLIDTAGGPIVGGARRVAALTWDAISRARQMRMLSRECPWLDACVAEENLDELRLHLPLLLGWDLGRLQRKSDVNILVCLDTFEHVSHGPRRARSGDVEDAISRSIFYLPSVLFMLTSRNRLDWGTQQRTATMEYAGQKDWPALSAAGSDQYRVGELSPADSELYLESCLSDAKGQPAIPEPLRKSIAGMSVGLPLYLDVAVHHFRNIMDRGDKPLISDFGKGLPEIVLRMMEDLSDDETDLLRVAALLGVFDRQTLRVALPDIRSSAIEHFLERSFVTARSDHFYSVHEMLQTSVRLQDAATSNPWSEDDWRRVEERLVAYWTAQLQDMESPIWRDRRTQSLAFWQFAGLYATTDVPAEGLAYIIMQVQLHGVWATIDAARSQPDSLLTGRGRALLQVLDGMMERQIGALAAADRFLSRALDSADLTGDLRRLALYYLGETRDLGAGDARPIFQEIMDTGTEGDRLTTEAQLALAHSLARHGDLTGALDIADHLNIDEDDPEFSYRYQELLGVIHWSAGQFEQSATAFERSRQVALAQSSPLLTGLATRHLALASCWIQPVTILPIIDRAEALNRDLGMKPGIGQCLMSRATALAGTEPLSAIEQLLEEAHDVFTGAGYLDDALGPRAVEVFAAAVDGDDELAKQHRRRLYREASGRLPRHWLAVSDVWTGQREAFDQVRWPQGADKAWQAWSDVLTRRRNGGSSRP